MTVNLPDYPRKECFDLPEVSRNLASKHPCEIDEKVLQDLAKLTPLDYERVRFGHAKELDIRIGILDEEVAKRRPAKAEQEVSSVVEEIVPWKDSVNGDALLSEMQGIIDQHVILPRGASTALALWALGTYCMDAWRLFPKVFVTSPLKRSGKSTLMEVMEGLLYRSLLTSNITSAALFRSIEKWKPSLLIDEADTFAKDNNELNGIINAGHTRRTARVVRVERVGDDFEPRVFVVFCPLMLAGIGRQRDTLEDRSIIIRLGRKPARKTIVGLPHDYFEKCLAFRRRCLRWAADNLKKMEAACPHAPAIGNDRARDNWGPLFVIADLAGGKWPEQVRAAYASMVTSDDEDTASIMLLSDIRQVFANCACDRIHSSDLVSALVKMDDRPWAEWKQGGPLTKNSISRLLKPLGIHSRQLKINGVNLHGYSRDAFEDTFDCYLPPDTLDQNATSLQASNGVGFSECLIATGGEEVADENRRKPSNRGGCSEVAFQDGCIEKDTVQQDT